MRKLCLMAVCGFMLAACPLAAHAQAPIPGQPYQVPPEYGAVAGGSQIAYGGFNYVSQGDGTMLLAVQPEFTYTSQYVPPSTLVYRQPYYRHPYWRGPGYDYGRRPYWNGGGNRHGGHGGGFRGFGR
jgi:hypothetical protein